jgi:hypothetical protein
MRRIYEDQEINAMNSAESQVDDEETRQEVSSSPSVCALAKDKKLSDKPENTQKFKAAKTKRKVKKEQKSDAETDQWVSYIQGNGPRPKHASPTVISSSRPERAANKPLVIGSIEGIKTKIFFDTGAEINVIDEALLHTLKSRNPGLKMHQVDSFIRCANDTKIRALGKVKLNVLLQGIATQQVFTVVRGIFPRIIVGIRQMKRCQISVDPKYDCIWIKNNRIPFVSKVVPVSDQENEFQLAH